MSELEPLLLTRCGQRLRFVECHIDGALERADHDEGDDSAGARGKAAILSHMTLPNDVMESICTQSVYLQLACKTFGFTCQHTFLGPPYASRTVVCVCV